MSSTLRALKAKSASQAIQEKRQLDRRRELLCLTHQFLLDQGFITAAEQLQADAGISLSKFEVADNIDLPIVFQHFLEYYEMRFGKLPKIMRKLDATEAQAKKLALRGGGNSLPTQAPISNNHISKRPSAHLGPTTKTEKTSSSGSKTLNHSNPESEAVTSNSREEISVSGHAVHQEGGNQALEVCGVEEKSSPADRLLKPLSQFLHGSTSDTRELALTISRDIFTENPQVRWEDVVGLEDAKRLLQEAVVMPARFPELFQGGLVSPWKGVLLFGPPGTGKTMLAKAVATECRTTFFNISASSIVSRYRGDSEKLIRILFDLARYHAPSTIFLDEIDSIMGQRGGSGGSGGGEHEASRRMKTELLIQMDGLARAEDAGIFVLAASNLPWELDHALLRRLEKRVRVRLPCAAGRQSILEKLLPPDHRTKNIDYAILAEKTEGYSCADITLLCKEAAMYPIRRAMTNLSLTSAQGGPQVGPVLQDDALAALQATRPSAHATSEQAYERWHDNHGSS